VNAVCPAFLSLILKPMTAVGAVGHGPPFSRPGGHVCASTGPAQPLPRGGPITVDPQVIRRGVDLGACCTVEVVTMRPPFA
jgi:hypothetical protein